MTTSNEIRKLIVEWLATMAPAASRPELEAATARSLAALLELAISLETPFLAD